MSVPPGNVDAVHALLESVWADAPRIPMMERFKFETALLELASNVVKHADGGSGLWCTLEIDAHPARIEATVLDDGEPSDLQVLVPRDMPDALSESGRGLAMIQALVDDLEYSREGTTNRWRISSRFEPEREREPERAGEPERA
jgi:serine/threonine-protein kinase RsbW